MVTDTEKKLDYAAFLADLEAKRAVLDQAIASLRAVMAGGALAGSVGDAMLAGVTDGLHGGEVPAGAFHGKSVPEAAKLYLSIVKQKKSTREIAEALVKGGMQSNAKNFEITVGTGLYRASKNSGEIVRVKGAWGLAEWWPAGVRIPLEKGNTRKGKRGRPKSVKTITASAPRAESNGHGNTQEQIANFLRSNPAKIYTTQEVSEGLGIDARATAMTLGRLVAKNLAEKLETGKYRAAHG
jgi:hypothetical protein